MLSIKFVQIGFSSFVVSWVLKTDQPTEHLLYFLQVSTDGRESVKCGKSFILDLMI